MQAFGLYAVLKNHAVTSLGMSDFFEPKTNQRLAACQCCILGLGFLV